MKKQISNQINRPSRNADEEQRNVINSSRNQSNNQEFGEATTLSNNEELELEFESAVIPLSDEDQQRLLLASSLAIDIFSDIHIAQEFAENPSAYMEMRDLSYEGDLDYGIIQMALAFADDGIRQAILNHDIEGFILQCQAQGLLALPIGIECANSEEITQLLERIGIVDGDIIIQNEGVLVEVLLVLIVIVIANIAAAVNLIANINVGVNANIIANVDSGANGYSSSTEISDLVLSPITLWAILNEDIESSYIVLNEIADNYYAQIDTYLTNNFTEYASNEEYRNRVQVFVKANLIKYLMQ